MTRTFATCVLSLLLIGSAMAQETNDAGGSMTSNSIDPDATCPFAVTDTIDFEVGGNANSGFILLIGTFSPGSLLIGSEPIDLDTSASISILGDGIGNTSAFPGQFFNTGANASSNWSVPSGTADIATGFALQSIVSDPGSAPFPLNTTAAPQFQEGNPFFVPGATTVPPSPNAVLTGDDAFQTYSFLGSGFTLYGTTYTECTISTNGWIKFGGTVTSADLGSSSADFISGDVGGAGVDSGPCIAPLWEDLDMGNNPGQGVYVTEDTMTNSVQFVWFEGDYFSATSFGTVSCTITEAGGITSVALDYGFFDPTLQTIANGPLIGVSQGATGGADIETDLACSVTQAVNPQAGIGAMGTYFQNFDGGGATAAEIVDLSGQTITFVDSSMDGNWTIF